MNLGTYREAITAAIADEMAADPSVFVFGEDIAAAGGVFKLTEGLLAQFGPERVLDTPISEQAIVGTAIGAAMMGLRPVAELMFADFAAVCYDQIANQLAKHRYVTGGQVSLPVTLRLVNGAGAGFGAQHSQSVENWFLNIPGLKIAVPSNAGDAYALLRASIRDDDPVLFFEHKGLLGMKTEVTESDALPFGRAALLRNGDDVTLVATQVMVHRAVAAASALAASGIEADVIDLRTIAPMDLESVNASLRKTRHLVVVQESPAAGSWGATLIAKLVQDSFEEFDAAPQLVSGDDTPIPYAGALEEAWIPSSERIVQAVIGIVN